MEYDPEHEIEQAQGQRDHDEADADASGYVTYQLSLTKRIARAIADHTNTPIESITLTDRELVGAYRGGYDSIAQFASEELGLDGVAYEDSGAGPYILSIDRDENGDYDVIDLVELGVKHD